MEKNVIEVPRGIRFLSDWKEFNLNNFPNKCIINKQIPGCGFTEYCLTSQDDLILCSPRIMLIKNKEDQHKGEVYVVHNSMEKDVEIDKDLNKSTPKAVMTSKKLTEEEIKERNKEIYKRLYSEISEYINFRRSQNLPCKIIVTYDSYHLVLSILQKLNIMYRFKTVVDEFQSILHDARFKSSTEISFLENLINSPTAYFVSATPMLDEYLEMLDEFKDLPYFDLDWKTLQSERVIKPSLKVLYMDSTISKACEVIQECLDEKYEEANVVNDKGEVENVVSNEIVIYVNSVNHITSIIKKMGLTPDQVNILCSDTEENRKKIKKKLGKKYDIGSVPLKGEKHKQFTFCTRTTYLGADFYSTCARTFIFSDSNIDCMAVDIAEDLPQILGRQRLIENPWKNCATLYYKTISKNKTLSEEDFNKKLSAKLKKSASLIEIFNGLNNVDQMNFLADNYEKVAKTYNYKDDYVAVNHRKDIYTGKFELVPVFNNLVFVNEKRAFRIAQIDYKDRFSVFSNIKSTFNDVSLNTEADNLLDNYNRCTTIVDRLKVLCLYKGSSDIINSVLDRISNSDEVKSLYKIVGPEKIKATGYNITDIRGEFRKLTFNDVNMYADIYSKFFIGMKVNCSFVKEELKYIYSNHNYCSSPKSTDLFEYFILRDILLSETDELTKKRKRIKGYEILDYKKDSKAYIAYQNYLMSQEALQNLIEQENKNNI